MCLLQRLESREYVYLLLYVDDILVACKYIADLDILKQQLKSVFEMKDLGPTQKILGIYITRDKRERNIKISQGDYIKKVLDRFNLSIRRCWIGLI